YSLQDSPADQLGRVGREAGAERGQGEHEKAGHVRLLASEQVAETPGHQDEHCCRDQIGEDHPYSANRPVWQERSRLGRAMIKVPELVAAISMPRLVQESAHHL